MCRGATNHGIHDRIHTDNIIVADMAFDLQLEVSNAVCTNLTGRFDGSALVSSTKNLAEPCSALRSRYRHTVYTYVRYSITVLYHDC